ncbi:hypothetical protein N332_08330, partial [Mesitornis unicolor]
LFIGFPPLNMSLCNVVYVVEIPSLFFIISPSGTSLQIVLVLESAVHRTIHINNYRDFSNPSDKFRTGIQIFSILQEGLGSLKQLYKKFRFRRYTPMPFMYP